nr:hypothetical protein [Rhodopirellula sp. MGV]
MSFDNPSNNRQTRSAAATILIVLVQAPEDFKHLIPIAFVDTNPIVANVNHIVSILGTIFKRRIKVFNLPDFDPFLISIIIFDRVRDQVHQYLPNTGEVANDRLGATDTNLNPVWGTPAEQNITGLRKRVLKLERFPLQILPTNP